MRVLVVDDNEAVRQALQLLCVVHDLPVEVASTPEAACHWVRQGDISVVVQDMNFTLGATKGEEGRALFRTLRAIDPDLRIILLTAYSDLPTAVELVREGADDYVEKPWDDVRLVRQLKRFLEQRRTAREVAHQPQVEGLIYRSSAMARVVALALRVAPATVPVLVTGPSGVGKERIAKLIADHSGRPGRFVPVNCGALPDSLIEAELFGVRRGAFTGAERDRRGRFQEARQGTLFLDEIATLSSHGQAALLRALETQEIRALGGGPVERVDVRVAAATNIDLRASDHFRDDLYFRLAAVEIAIPPLATRPDDIDALADAFLAEQGLDPEVLEGTARAALHAHDWPGNVRELKHAIQRGALTRQGERVGASDLGLVDARGPVGDDEREQIEQALREADGVVAHAARALGLSRQALYRRMERLGVQVQRRVRR
ncbi:MAG: sigma-54 dependent transcriptional regulator [Myxococcota bacterium]